VSAIDRPVRIWSGLVTDAVAQLHADGHLAGPALTSYTWGSAALRALAAAGMLHLRPCEITHDLTAISATPRFVACNTALQVGLDGSVNVERVGGRVIAAIGGHADFCVGASRSAGGASIIALRSTTQRGDSTIVPAVEVVSTARSDVQFVVTEYGTADLRSAGTAERAARLIDVAAPQHRAQLAEHASC
jgi:acyl-CoA hydrolase